MKKRTRPGWDEYFMDIAEEVSRRSKDPATQLGCVIVDKNRRPVSFGYNGMIQGADESKMTLLERPMKYYFAIHSEMNAVLFAHEDLTGYTIYNTVATCENCLKYCLQAGIKRFVYRQLRVASHSHSPKKSMTNVDTDEAILRLLAAMPEVETLNLTNRKTYVQDILDSYEEGSAEWERLKAWT